MREYFDKELTQLNDSLIEMGGLVEQAIKNTMKMIVDGEDLLDIAREHENRINEAEKNPSKADVCTFFFIRHRLHTTSDMFPPHLK